MSELGFGVGIALGYAALGRSGFEDPFDYAAIGVGKSRSGDSRSRSPRRE